MAAPKTIAANAYRHRNRRAWIESQGGRCAVCGSTDSLEVDHKDPAEKEISPTYLWVMGPNNPRRIAELAKCQVLCVGCHRGKSGREISAMKVQWHSENREQHSERMRHWHAEKEGGVTVRRFTSSELRQWQLCRRSWYLRHFLGYGPKRDEGEVSASRTGTLVHAGLEVFYRDNFEEAAAVAHVEGLVEANVAALTEAGRDGLVKTVQSQGEMARIMLEGYFEWTGETGVDADLEITGAEQRIEVPFEAAYFRGRFGVEVTLLGLADLLALRRSSGKRLILDFKSVQNAGDQETLAPMSPQFKHYAVILEMLGGERVDGALVRWLRRVKRSARATPPFYGEIPVMWPKTVLRSYHQHTLVLIEEILRAEEMLRAGLDPIEVGIGPTVTRDCGRCVFRPVCPLLDDETVDETDVLRWSYARVDPLARYAADETEDE